MDRQLPKALHTLTVLENLARHILADENAPITAPYAVNAVNLALKILKLDHLPDGHGLVAATLLKIKGKADA